MSPLYEFGRRSFESLESPFLDREIFSARA